MEFVFQFYFFLFSAAGELDFILPVYVGKSESVV